MFDIFPVPSAAHQQIVLNIIIGEMFPAELFGKITVIFTLHSCEAELMSPKRLGIFICSIKTDSFPHIIGGNCC